MLLEAQSLLERSLDRLDYQKINDNFVYFNTFINFLGNRWIVALFTATAHKQPPLDLAELEDVEIEYPNKYPVSFAIAAYVV